MRYDFARDEDIICSLEKQLKTGNPFSAKWTSGFGLIGLHLLIVNIFVGRQARRLRPKIDFGICIARVGSPPNGGEAGDKGQG